MEFDALIDLVKTITRNKVKHIEVLGNPGEDPSLVEQLYEAIAQGKVASDENAIEYLYKENEPTKNAYLRLKYRLVRQLTNTALFVDVDQPMFNDRAKALYNCYRDFAAANVLIMRNAKKAGLSILRSVLEHSMKFEFVELSADIAWLLRREYGRMAADQINHANFSKLHRQYEEKRRWEMMALDYFEDLVNYYLARRSPNAEIQEMASRYFEELQPLAPQVDTSQFYFCTYQIGIIKYLAANNCLDALKLCEESLSRLENRPNTNRGALVNVGFQKMACLTQLRIFENDEGETTAKYCLELSEEGSFNWFRSLELHLQYCFYVCRYDQAFKIFAQAIQHTKYKSLTGPAHDSWTLFGGYMHVLASLGKLKLEEVEKVAGTFRFSKIANEIDAVNREKEGMNIPLVALQLLYYLATNGSIEVSFDAIEKYRQRYMKEDMNRRSNAFLNMLIGWTQRLDKPKAAESKIRTAQQVLKDIPVEIAGQTFAVEILPYEDVWNMLMEKLGEPGWKMEAETLKKAKRA